MTAICHCKSVNINFQIFLCCVLEKIRVNIDYNMAVLFDDDALEHKYKDMTV